MIRPFIDKSLIMTGQALSYLCPSLIPKALQSIRDKIYTGYIRRRFAHCGNSYFLWRPYNLKGTKYISIGNDNIFESGLQLTAWESEGNKPHIKIGNGCMIRRDNHFTATTGITIANTQHLLCAMSKLFMESKPLLLGVRYFGCVLVVACTS